MNAGARTREILGANWRTVGIACKPSFLTRELSTPGQKLPEDVRRFQAGDPDIAFWYAGEITHEMSHVTLGVIFLFIADPSD